MENDEVNPNQANPKQQKYQMYGGQPSQRDDIPQNKPAKSSQ